MTLSGSGSRSSSNVITGLAAPIQRPQQQSLLSPWCQTQDQFPNSLVGVKLTQADWVAATSTDMECLLRRVVQGEDNDTKNKNKFTRNLRDDQSATGKTSSGDLNNNNQLKLQKEELLGDPTPISSSALPHSSLLPLDLSTIPDLATKLNACSQMNHCCRGLSWRIFRRTSSLSMGTSSKKKDTAAPLLAGSFPLEEIEHLSSECLLDVTQHEDQSLHHLEPDQLRQLQPQ